MAKRKAHLRGSVTQNVSLSMREQDGISFLARLGVLAIGALLLLLGAIASWQIGWPQRKALGIYEGFLDLTKAAHFEIRDIAVEGRNQSSKDEIFDALSVKQGMAILAIDIQAAAARIGKLPWVDSAVVERQLPDTIYVSLTERVPSARWQLNERFFVIDARGRVIPSAKAADFPQLPQVVGAGADREAHALVAVLKDYADIRDKMEYAVRVSERRWDLHMTHKIIVRLPELNVDRALHRLSVLIAEEKILDRPLVAIDLRIPDRLVLEPTEESKQTGEKKP